MVLYISPALPARCTAGAAWLRVNSRSRLRALSFSARKLVMAAVTCPTMPATRFVSPLVNGSRREKSIRPISLSADLMGTVITDWISISLYIFEINFWIRVRDFSDKSMVWVNSIIHRWMVSGSLIRHGSSANNKSCVMFPSSTGMRMFGRLVPISFSIRFTSVGGRARFCISKYFWSSLQR